ncbi:MAG: T9SS type A sorting domain-containing protein [Bacteroidota bacterium]
MKSLFSFTLICTLCISLKAQSVKTSVLLSAGGGVSSGNTQMTWALGETFASTLDVSPQIKQGFVETIDITLSVSSRTWLSLPLLRIYPNPTPSILNISGINRKGDWSVRLFDLYGREVLTQRIHAFSSSQIKLDALSPGTYVLSLFSASETTKPIQVVKRN